MTGAFDKELQAKPAAEEADNVALFVNPGVDPSEDAVATAFTCKYGGVLKFDHQMKSWYEWDGSYWKRDLVERAFHFARDLARQIGKGSGKMGKASVAGGAERFARAHPLHAVATTIWDQDAFLLGTPEGTVDLKTGQLQTSEPTDFITKRTSVAPRAGKPTRWLQFLDEATGGDQELVRFLQRICGYALTGDVREHALFFVYGSGKNGKSVFLNTLQRILGEYAVTSAMETFTASRFDKHPTGFAMLRGARLVTASETEEGRAWAEATIKQLTGGDAITARFMAKDFFTYQPQFKLLIVGNHQPTLHNVDEATRRRFNIIPFTRQPARPDLQLETKLEAEHGEILQWMIDGCLEWQEFGLGKPKAVREATEAYFDDQDLMGQWINDRCVIDNPADASRPFEETSKLFADWSSYAKAAGEEPGSQKAFGTKLNKRGFSRDRLTESTRARIYRGIALRIPDRREPYADN